MSDELKQTATAETTEKTEKASKATKAKPKKGKKARAQISQGKAFIQATYNNTIVSLSDMNGNVLAWGSAGMAGFKGPKKATPYAASVIVRDVLEKVTDIGLKDVNVYISGVGQGREGALRALNANGLNVLSIKDVTPVPHNGCRPPRPRRV
jgi:small subunit ribosomal protein S11